MRCWKAVNSMSTIYPIQLYSQPYEAYLNFNGNNYHLIFGEQINGCASSKPSDCFWNQGSMEQAGITTSVAAVISKALQELSELI